MPQASQGAKHAEQNIMRLPHICTSYLSCLGSVLSERLHAPPHVP